MHVYTYLIINKSISFQCVKASMINRAASNSCLDYMARLTLPNSFCVDTE